jgi:hypothetical protein
MSNSLMEDLEKDPDRFAKYVIEQDPNISSYEEMFEALKGTFVPKAVETWGTEELMRLFDCNAMQDTIRRNTSEEKLKKENEEIKRGEIELQRDGKQVLVQTPKKVTARSYTRAGKSIKSYNRGFQRWTPAEVTFLKIRKQRKLSPKKAIYEFNQHFKDNQRSSSSVKSKLYRT